MALLVPLPQVSYPASSSPPLPIARSTSIGCFKASRSNTHYSKSSNSWQAYHHGLPRQVFCSSDWLFTNLLCVPADLSQESALMTIMRSVSYGMVECGKRPGSHSKDLFLAMPAVYGGAVTHSRSRPADLASAPHTPW